MRGSLFKSLLVTAAALGLAVPIATQAAISFGAGGTGVLTFDTAPAVTEWSTLPLAGAGNTILDEAAMDAAVQALTAAGISTALPTSATQPPSTSALGARYNTAGMFLQTRPTAVAAVVLLGTFSNDSGSSKAAVDISYNLNRQSLAATPGELVGHDVYYSLTGNAGEWVKIPALTRVEIPGSIGATISPAGGWAAGTPLYLLWADDNADGITDPSYTIDNLSLIPSGAPPTISGQPTPTVTVNERGTVTLSVVASGSAITYQWFKGVSALANGASCVDGHDRTISGATGSTLTIAGVQPSDGGLYHCEVSGPNPPSPAVSMNANVTVTADTTPPTVRYAICGANLNEFVVVFSEPMYDSCQPPGAFGPVTDTSSWIIEDVGGLSLGAAGITNLVALQNGQTMLGITTSLSHDPTKTVKITWTTDFTDQSLAQNTLPAGSVMALCYTNDLVPLSANWQYNDDDVDPGATWKNVGFADGSAPWATGAGPFDSKRDGGIVGPDGLDDCRAMTLYGLGAVGTCLSQQSPVTMTNLITAYFRTHFNFVGSPSSAVLVLDGKFDDSAAVYLNGTEIWRIGVAAGATHTTFATRTVGDGDAQDSLILGAPAALVSGDNVLAVELHQVNLTSTDLTMGLHVSQLVSSPPIVLSIVHNPGGTVTITWSGGGTLRSTTSITTARPWPAVGGAASPYTTPAGGTQKFFDVTNP